MIPDDISDEIAKMISSAIVIDNKRIAVSADNILKLAEFYISLRKELQSTEHSEHTYDILIATLESLRDDFEAVSSPPAIDLHQ